MSRLARRKDGNQAEIERALTCRGIFWFDTSRLGFGFPDLVVLHKGRVLLVEIKQSGEKLTDKELTFYCQALQAGVRVVIAYTAQDILNEFVIL